MWYVYTSSWISEPDSQSVVWGSLCVILDTTPPNPYVLVYIWSIFAINLVLTLVTGEHLHFYIICIF